jgi:ABC-type long-subunit fatty acid transport system fused permease/ATPase subunit
MIITKRLKRLSYHLYGWNVDGIVEGFGVRVKNDTLNFSQNSKTMEGYSFKINFRNQIITVSITHFETTFSVDGTKDDYCG